MTPEQQAALQELQRRGKLSPEQAAAAAELSRRNADVSMTTPEMVMPQQASPQKPKREKRSTLDDLLIGIGRGYQDTLAGLRDLALIAGQVTARGQVGDDGSLEARVAEARQQGVAADQRDQATFAAGPGESSPVASAVGRIGGNIASLPMPGPAGRSASLRAAEGLGLGAAEGFAAPAASAEDRLRNAGVGALTGGVVQGGVEAASSMIPRREGVAEEIVQLGEQYGVPVYADDVIDSKSLRVGVDSASQVPLVGPAGGKGRQNRAQLAAAEREVESARLSLGGDSEALFEDVIQESMQRRLGELKRVVGQRYRAVGQELDPAGAIPLDGFRELAEELIAKERARGSRANEGMIAALESFRDAPEGNFSDTIRLRSDLGEEVAAFYSGKNEALPTRGVEAFQQLKDRLSSDMTEFAGGVSEGAVRRWEGANRFYAQRIAPFRETALRRLVNTEEPEKLLRFVLANSGRQGGTRSRAELMYNALDERGRGAVRAAVLQRALEDASSDARAFSPQKFANRIEEIRNVIPVFFRGKAGREVEGFKRLMEHTSRSASYATEAPTGARLVSALILLGQAGEGLESAYTVTTAAGAAAALKAITQTKGGRDLLLRASRAAPGSEDMSRVSRLISTIARRGAVRAAVTDDDPQDSPEARSPQQ